MKTISTALQTHLDGEVTSLVTCWAIVRIDEEMNFLTDHDQDIVIPASTFLDAESFLNTTYTANTGYIRSAISTNANGIGNLEIESILGGPSSTVMGADIEAGKYDLARVYLFMVNWADLTQGVIKLPGAGWLGEVTRFPKQGLYKVECRGFGDAFHRVRGELYTPVCRTDLFSARCKLLAENFERFNTVDTVTNKREWTVPALGLPVFTTNDITTAITNPSFETDADATVDPNITGWTAEDHDVGQFRVTTTGTPAPLIYSMTASTSVEITTAPDNLTRTVGSWLDEGFLAGQSISITNSDSNEGTHVINTVSALVIETVGTLIVEPAQTDLVIVSVDTQQLQASQQTNYVGQNAKMVSDLITIPTGGGGEPTTVEIDDGYTTITIGASLATDVDLTDTEFRLGAEFYTSGDVIIDSRKYGDMIAITNTHTPYSRVFAMPPTTRKMKIVLEFSNTSGTLSNGLVDDVTLATDPIVVLDIPGGKIADYWDGGVVYMESGANEGVAREVDSFVDGTKTIKTFLQFPFDIEIGDVYRIIPGCKKRWELDCVTKFDNGINHQGEPFVPGQDALYDTPSPKG